MEGANLEISEFVGLGAVDYKVTTRKHSVGAVTGAREFLGTWLEFGIGISLFESELAGPARAYQCRRQSSKSPGVLTLRGDQFARPR